MGFAEARIDREVILEQASRARSRRQWRRAIALYRQVLGMMAKVPHINARRIKAMSFS